MAKRYLTPADMAQLQEGARPPQTRTPSSSGSAPRTGRERETVHSITATPEALSVNMGRRMKVYGVQMLLRVACFFGFVLIDNIWWRIACVVGMVVLPWSAVLLANAGADKSERSSLYMSPELHPELTAVPHTAYDDDAAASPDGDVHREPQTGVVPERTDVVGDRTVVEGEWS